ncbi:MAG TPA: hypothetical protein ENK21_02055 [Trueperaceae bacterium]|nr:hypothetical protein [Trueperaceae bacterium]
MDKQIVVEIAQFRLLPAVNEQEFLVEVELSQKSFLEKQRGYIDRELLKDESGLWVDILHWQTMQDALKAAEQMMQEEVVKGFISKIDSSSITMLHLKQKGIWKP